MYQQYLGNNLVFHPVVWFGLRPINTLQGDTSGCSLGFDDLKNKGCVTVYAPYTKVHLSFCCQLHQGNNLIGSPCSIQSTEKPAFNAQQFSLRTICLTVGTALQAFNDNTHET